MGFKTILVHVEPTAESEARLRCAVSMAESFEARLVGCGCEAEPTHFSPDGLALQGSILQARDELIDSRIRSAEQRFLGLTHGMDRRWISDRLSPSDAIPQHARGADLIVTSRHSRGSFDPYKHDDPGLLVVIAGRPVVLAPPDRDYLRAGRILVCWKDAREARRAVFDALPFLTRADEVLIVEVSSESEEEDAEARLREISDALGQHGVSCGTQVILKDSRQVASILRDAADAFSADLIVAGAFGRSRVGEWAFGGVTRSLMEQNERFVLFSH